MDRLLNIGREGGFPICSETLSVLNENSEMLENFLQALPGMARTAIMFGNYLFVSDALSHTHRIIKVDSVGTGDFENCKLVFSTSTHSVHDSSDNEIPDVWKTDTADIVAAAQGEAKWRILRFEDVFELKLWHDHLQAFEAGLQGATVSSGSFVSAIALYEDNVLRGNNERIQMRLSLSYTIRAQLSSILSIPIPFDCPDGTRMEADLQVINTGTHYPVRAYTEGGMLKIDIGRWLQDEGLFINHADWIQCNDIIRINKEVIL